MCIILIMYHSQTGNTLKMAASVAKGVASIDNVKALLKKATDVTLEDLLECNGLVIGSPEYFGYMAGMIKDFFDRTYYKALDRKEIYKKPYALFISAGNDGTGALNNIKRICLGYQFKEIFEPVVAKGEINAEIIARCEELGTTIAAGCKENIY